MKITRRVMVSIIYLTLATGMLIAPPTAISLATAGSAAAAAPTSAIPLANQQSCSSVGAGTECSSPGNVQINDSPPAVADYGFAGGFYPGPYPVPFAEGGR
jgi:hypothetical protein